MVYLKGQDIYLNSLLRQEGVPFAVEEIDARIFINTRNGQTILSTTSDLPKEVLGKRVRVKFLAPDRTEIFFNTGLVDINAWCLIPKSANTGKTDKGQNFLYQGEDNGSGRLIVLPFEPKFLLRHRGTRLKRFLARGRRLPYETVATADRGGLRRLFAGCLRAILNFQNIPYLHLSYVPKGHRSVFGFRIDTDFSSPAEIIAAAEIAKRLKMRWTWFLRTATFTDDIVDVVKVLSGQEIQLHCHRHLIYPDFERNYRNFSQGVEILKRAGVNPKGVAAPYGIWNETLDKVFAELGFEYSSEFGYSYDDVPSRPIVNQKESPVMQIPVHPISLGRLVWAKMDEKRMIEYYQRVIDLQIARGEPCFLYDHPDMIVRYPRVITEVLKYGLERCGSFMTLGEYCRWWQQRERVKYSCRFNEGEIDLEAANGISDINIVLKYLGKMATLPLTTQRIDFDALKWEPVLVVPFDREEIRTKSYPLKLRIQEMVRQIQRRLQIKGEMV